MWNLEGPYQLMEFDETLLVVRQGRNAVADVAYIGGLPTAVHPPENFFITATWQPITGRDLMLLPEAFRGDDNAKLWQSHMDVNDTPHIDLGDIVVRLGIAWQVCIVQDWGDYTETTLKKIDVGTLSEPVADAVLDPLTGITRGPIVYPPTPGSKAI